MFYAAFKLHSKHSKFVESTHKLGSKILNVHYYIKHVQLIKYCNQNIITVSIQITIVNAMNIKSVNIQSICTFCTMR